MVMTHLESFLRRRMNDGILSEIVENKGEN